MSKLTLNGLYRYPVKSLRGAGLALATLDARGIRFDRRWMLINPEGRFLSQRQLPRMTLVRTLMMYDHLTLQAPDMSDLVLPRECADDAAVQVKIWQDDCLARSVGRDADAWLSEFLHSECRLVYLPDDQVRQVDTNYAKQGDQTGFTDGFPLLLISEASLQDLNSRMSEPLPMERFRPNLVVGGCEPYAEDSWKRIRIGEIEFKLVKPCSRCAITTVNPETAQTGVEPLKTLSSYRRQGNKVNFGQNLIHAGLGELRLGMDVEVIA